MADLKAGGWDPASISNRSKCGLGERLRRATGHSTMPVTEDGTAAVKLLGIVTERDYRLSRMGLEEKVATFMTPREKPCLPASQAV